MQKWSIHRRSVYGRPSRPSPSAAGRAIAVSSSQTERHARDENTTMALATPSSVLAAISSTNFSRSHAISPAPDLRSRLCLYGFEQPRCRNAEHSFEALRFADTTYDFRWHAPSVIYHHDRYPPAIAFSPSRVSRIMPQDASRQASSHFLL